MLFWYLEQVKDFIHKLILLLHLLKYYFLLPQVEVLIMLSIIQQIFEDTNTNLISFSAEHLQP